MNRDRLTNLINDENERSERDLADEARGIIRQITQEQGKIRSANKRIVELRMELAELSAEILDAADVLGGE